jgi:predicted RecA/RadA family phage recombinase
MATSSLIQYLEGTDAAGTTLGLGPSNRRVEEVFIASSAIAVGQWVALDLTVALSDGDKSLKVAPADGNGGAAAGPPAITSLNSVVVGVAISAAAAGARVEVVTRGMVEASVTESGAGIAVGDALQISNTAGVAVLTTGALVPVCGFLVDALAAAAGTQTRTVYVKANWS